MRESSMNANKAVLMSGRAGRIFSLVAGEIIIVIFWMVFLQWMNPKVEAVFFQDSLSLGLITGMVLIMLLVTGTFKNFVYAFVYCVEQNPDITVLQMKKSLFSLKLSMVTALLSGVSMAFVTIIDIFVHLSVEQVDFWGMFFYIPCLCILYGVLAVMLLLPIYARLRKKSLSIQ